MVVVDWFGLVLVFQFHIVGFMVYFHVRCAGELTVQITLRANCKTHPAVLGERVQHVVEESDTGADGDLLGRGELGRMAGFLGWHNAFLGGFGFFGVCWGGEVG